MIKKVLRPSLIKEIIELTIVFYKKGFYINHLDIECPICNKGHLNDETRWKCCPDCLNEIYKRSVLLLDSKTKNFNDIIEAAGYCYQVFKS